MSALKKTIIRGGLETLYFSGMHHLMRPLVGGVGVILGLHHVRPARLEAFQPNRLLEVTPDFLEQLLNLLVRSDVDVVSVDEMHRRLVSRAAKRRFVCFTFDDGYKDTLRWAYPLFKRYNLPFALYIPTSFPDQLGELWWTAMEAAVAQNDRIGLVIDGHAKVFESASVRQKRETYETLYWWLRSRLKTEDELRRAVRDLCARYRVDMAAICRDLCMSWEDIRQLAADPLVTIGAHTVNHYMLGKLPNETAVRREIEISRKVIETALGMRLEHFAYPVGDRNAAGPREFAIAAELGFKTAVTTRPGVLFDAHRDHLTALPRISVSGDLQQQRYLKVLLSGAASALWNGFRRVNAA